MAKKKVYVTITNKSKQMLCFQVRPPGGDYFATEQQVSLHAGKTISLPREFLLMPQVENMKARGQIAVVESEV